MRWASDSRTRYSGISHVPILCEEIQQGARKFYGVIAWINGCNDAQQFGDHPLA